MTEIVIESAVTPGAVDPPLDAPFGHGRAHGQQGQVVPGNGVGREHPRSPAPAQLGLGPGIAGPGHNVQAGSQHARRQDDVQVIGVAVHRRDEAAGAANPRCVQHRILRRVAA